MASSFSASPVDSDRFDTSAPIEPGGRRPELQATTLSCPSCGFEQAPADECLKCGLVIAKYRPKPAVGSRAAPERQMRSRDEIQADLANQGYAPRERVAASDQVEEEGFFAPERRGLKKGIVGGIVMMAIAVVWFGLGWAAGYIFFYPPVLFVIGLFGALKGIFTGNVAG